MSFMLGGFDAPRPTFFELVAAERLMPSLKAAASYSLQVRQRPKEDARCWIASTACEVSAPKVSRWVQMRCMQMMYDAAQCRC